MKPKIDSSKKMQGIGTASSKANPRNSSTTRMAMRGLKVTGDVQKRLSMVAKYRAGKDLPGSAKTKPTAAMQRRYQDKKRPGHLLPGVGDDRRRGA